MTTETVSTEQAASMTPFDMKSAGDAFEKLMVPIRQANEEAISANDVTQPPPVVKEPAKVETVPVKTETDGIPQHLLDGTDPGNADAPRSPVQELLDAAPPPKLSQAQAGNWQSMRKALEEADRDRSDLRRQLEDKPKESAPAAVDDTEVKSLREKVQEYETELERAGFERSPTYRKLLNSQKGALDAAKSHLEGTEVSPTIIDVAAGLRGPRRAAALREAGMDAETIALISPFLAQHDMIGNDRETAMGQHKELQAQWDSQQKTLAEREESKVKAEEMRTFQTVHKIASKSYAPFQKVDGNEQWNAQVDALLVEAEAIYNGSLPLEKLADAAHAAVAYKVADKIMTSQRATIKDLREQLSKLTAAQPKAAESNGHVAPAQNGNGRMQNAEELARDAGTRFEQRLAANR